MLGYATVLEDFFADVPHGARPLNPAARPSIHSPGDSTTLLLATPSGREIRARRDTPRPTIESPAPRVPVGPEASRAWPRPRATEELK